jgi:hypothetical protein
MSSPSCSTRRAAAAAALDPAPGSPRLAWFGGPQFTVGPSPDPGPSIDKPANQSNTEGDAVNLQITPSEPNILHYEALNLPLGLSIDPKTGLISGTVDYHAAEQFGGVYSPTVLAVNNHGLTASQSFQWNVADNPRAPILTKPGDQQNQPGDLVSLPIQASQADGDQIIYAAGNLPTGLTIDTLTGTIFGTIRASAASNTPYTVTVTASNQTVVATQTFNWVVPLTPSPVLMAPADQTNSVGDVVSLSLAATDPRGLPLTYSASNLPSGLSIDSAKGVISGTVAFAGVNPVPQLVKVTASDSAASATQTFNWKINYHVVINQPPDQRSAEGQWINFPIDASDPDGSATSFTATGLPAGLSIDPNNAAISGAISYTAAEVNGGLYTVTVAGTDSLGGSDSKTFHWTVADAAFAAAGQDIKAVELTATGNVPVAQFSVENTSTPASAFSAVIDWGDGAKTAGTITSGANPGLFQVTGNHTYTAAGFYVISTAITQNGTTTTAQATANVDAAALTASGQTVSAVASQPIPGATIASFTDGDPNRAASAYTAKIDWGDGHLNDPGAIVGGGGNFTVSGGHTYAEPGTYTVYTTITNLEGGNSDVAVGSVVVQPAALTLTPRTVQTTEGVGDLLTLATLNDANPNETSGDFTISVNWGDGTTTNTDTISGGQGNYTLSGHHVFSAPGTYSVHLILTDSLGGSATADETVTVLDAPLTSKGFSVSMSKADASPPAVLATFHDPNSGSLPQDFSAVINWGAPGVTSAPYYINGRGGVFTLTGNLPYKQSGKYNVTIQISDRYGQTTTAAAFVTVGDVMVYQAANLSIYGFTSSQPGAQPGDFSASINWGDGADAAHPDISGGQVVSAGNVFGVKGGHTYLSAGTFSITVTVIDSWGNSITTGGGVLVGETLSGAGQSITKLEGSLGAFLLGSVFTGDVTASAGSFQAFIDWGDGTGLDTSGYFLANKAGGYDLIGVHTYVNAGLYHIVAAMLLAGAAVVTDADAVAAPNWDDPKYALKLDVNNNGVLDEKLDGGVPDGVDNYLPGYEGTTAKLSKSGDYKKDLSDGGEYDHTVFTPQLMSLVLDGVGKEVLQGANAASVSFEIPFDPNKSRSYDVTANPGYAGNKTDNAVSGNTRDDDYSFDPDVNLKKANPSNVTVATYNTSTPFWAKDYGGWAVVKAHVLDGKGKDLKTFSITIPVDTNNNYIADVWEKAQALETQQWEQLPAPPDWKRFLFQNGKWQDANTGPAPVETDKTVNDPVKLPARLTVGDGLSPAYEYRGVIVDGGGFSPDGKTSRHGHVRLSTAEQQALIDVNEMQGAAIGNSILPPDAAPPLKVEDWMDHVTAAYSQTNYGAGMLGYYVLDRMAAANDVFSGFNTIDPLRKRLREYMNGNRQSVSGVPIHNYWRQLNIGTRLASIDRSEPKFYYKDKQGKPRYFSGISGESSNKLVDIAHRIGSYFFATDGWEAFDGPLSTFLDNLGINKKDNDLPYNFDAYAAGVITHELAHQLSADAGHYADSDADGSQAPTSSDFRTVQFNYTLAPLQGYFYQDYWYPIRYGHGSSNDQQGKPTGFLANMDLTVDNMLDKLDLWDFTI